MLLNVPRRQHGLPAAAAGARSIAQSAAFTELATLVSESLTAAGRQCLPAAVACVDARGVFEVAFQQVVALCPRESALLAAAAEACVLEPARVLRGRRRTVADRAVQEDGRRWRRQRRPREV